MASVMGLELQHPTMSMLWEHVDRSKRKKEIILPDMVQLYHFIIFANQ